LPYRDQRLECPACKGPLSEVEWLRVARFSCHRCDGVWLPRASLGALAQALGLDIRVVESAWDGVTKGFRSCPQCAEPMWAKGFPVTIDICRQHGIYFDRDELAQMLAPLIEARLRED